MVTTTIQSKTFIVGSTCTQFLYEKKNTETLQDVEIRDGHSIALKNVLSFFNAGTGSTLQTDHTRDAFATDNAFKAKHMIYVTGGSYQCTNFGSTFFVLITCGSLNTSDFAINGCRAYKYAQGSYLLYGPDGPSLGSSRARVMKTLFYGDSNNFVKNPRAGSEYINSLGSIYVGTNSFGDVGRRAYAMGVSGNKTAAAFDTAQYNLLFTGSFEASAGSIWSWSYITTSSTGGATTLGSWAVPEGTRRNGASNGTSDETGLDTLTDVFVSPGSVRTSITMIAGGGGTPSTGNGSVFAYFLTPGSVLFATDTLTLDAAGSYVRDFAGSGVPKFGSITDPEILDFNSAWVQFSPITGVNGSADTVVAKVLGSYSSDTTRYLSACADGGSNFTYMCEGMLGSVGPNTGSIIVRYEFFKAGSVQRDYVNAYGVYYG